MLTSISIRNFIQDAIHETMNQIRVAVADRGIRNQRPNTVRILTGVLHIATVMLPGLNGVRSENGDARDRERAIAATQ